MRYSITLFLLVTSIHSWSQDFDRYFNFSWDVNKPLTNTRWIDETSTFGFKVGYHRLLSDKFSVGVDLTDYVYHHYEPKATFITDGGAITTDFFNYVYSYGLVVNGKYFIPTQNRKVMPFLGLGAGVSANRFVQSYNIYTDTDDTFGFLARPEAGVLVSFGGKLGIIASAHYDYSTAGSDYFDYSGFTNYGVNLGLVFMSY